MMSHLVDEASKKIPSVPYLVNVVSKRVRQLNAGHKPMVDVIGRMGLADIALTEIEPFSGISNTTRTLSINAA